MLHAPRQTGKTSALIALRDLLNSGEAGDFRCVDVNVEPGQVARDDVASGIGDVLGGIADSAMLLGDDYPAGAWRNVLAEMGPHNALRSFHAVNGYKHVNHQVVVPLDKLRVEFTRSRPRRSNDNALVESKNASVVRRHLGREHIPAEFAPLVHEFASRVLSPHLNYHRPCLFASESVGEDGKARKVYRDRDAATPCERLKAVDGAERFLKPGVSFAALDAKANTVGDLESARRVARERDRLFRAVRDRAAA